jgi:tetratricopeptide (TPR) repeat protein
MLLGVAEAATGNVARARELGADSKAVMEELSPGWMVAGAELYAGLALLTGGEAAAAEAELRHAADLLAEHGERAVASTTVALRARALLELGRLEEAERDARVALEWAAADDVFSQAYARGTLARLLAARGEAAEAVDHAREAVALSEASDFLTQRGDALFDLAVALEAAGDEDAANAAAVDALGFYRAKGNVVAAARVEVRLTAAPSSPIMEAHPAEVETMSEHDPKRPAPDSPDEEEGSPAKDILWSETEQDGDDDSSSDE